MKLSTSMNLKAQTKRGLHLSKPLIMALGSALILAACANSPKSPSGAVAARERLVQLQNDPELASRASVAIREADEAVTAAEINTKDKVQSDHLVFIATREVDTAWALARTRQLEDEREGLSEYRDAERLESRTREADQARAEAEALRNEIEQLNAEETERGLVVTLGDTLFETGKAQLTGNAFANLGKLSNFLNNHPERSLVIEGHTDSVGSESSNQSLSQRRADSVRQYLLQQGVAANRLTAVGKGESYPVASNDSTSGRALNRRVEVIIAK